MSINNNAHTYDFLALGEALIDFISTEIVESLVQPRYFQRFLGGQVTNLAMNMASLGNRVALAACVGEDSFGRFIAQQLQQGNVDASHLQFTTKDATSLSIIARQTKTPDFIIQRGADTNLELTAALQKAAENSRVVHTSAFALSQSPTRTTVLQLLAIAHEQGNVISLDPNYHPNIWPDTDNFLDILESTYKYVDITKPSLDDCKRIFGPEITPIECVESFLNWGAKNVVLTMGSEGAFLGSVDGSAYHIQANPAQVVDVTGAGDAFWSGMLSEFLNGSSLLESARFGQALAEIKIGTLGPLQQPPSYQQLRQSSQNISYKALGKNEIKGGGVE